MRVLVTGASGFLGRRLVAALAAGGDRVTAVSRRAAAAADANVTWLQRDLSRELLTPEEVDGHGAVVHLAGATLGAGTDEVLFEAANEATTVRVAKACAGRIPRFVMASSQVVYGYPNHLAVTEDFPLDGTASAYACSKVNAENWLRWFQRRHGGLYVLLRLSGFVEGGGSVDYLIARARENHPIELFAGGTVRRDYLSADRGVEALAAATTFPHPDGVVALNIGSGQQLTSLEMARLVCVEAGSESEIRLSAERAPQGDLVFDITRAARALGFRPGVLADDIKAYVRRRRAAREKGQHAKH